MDGYEVVLRPAAQRDLRKIPATPHERIVEALRALKEQPRPKRVRKIAGQSNEWRLRVGDYRILYEIDDANRAVRYFGLPIAEKCIASTILVTLTEETPKILID